MSAAKATEAAATGILTTDAGQHGALRVAAYLVVSRDPTKTAALRAKLVAFQRSLGVPAAVYEDHEHPRRRPKRRRLVLRGRLGGFDLVVCLRFGHLGSSRSRVAQVVLQLGVPVVTPTGLRLDPVDREARRVLRWVAKEQTEHRGRIRRALDAKRVRGERVGAIPVGSRLAEDGVHLVPDADGLRAIATARELAGRGVSLRKIASALSDAGHRTRGGKPVTHRQVGRMLGRNAGRS